MVRPCASMKAKRSNTKLRITPTRGPRLSRGFILINRREAPPFLEFCCCHRQNSRKRQPEAAAQLGFGSRILRDRPSRLRFSGFFRKPARRLCGLSEAMKGEPNERETRVLILVFVLQPGRFEGDHSSCLRCHGAKRSLRCHGTHHLVSRTQLENYRYPA